MTDTTATAPAGPAAPRDDRPIAKLLGVLVGVPAVLVVMLLCFLVPSLASGASDLPLALGGPAQATDQIAAALDQQAPGSFATTAHEDPADARQAVLDRDAIGAVTVGADGVHIVVASGAGTPYAPLLRTLGAGLEEAGQPVTYEDVAPLTEEDPNGSALASLGLPLAFGGNVSAILLLTLLKNHPRLRLLGALAMSVTGGVATIAVLQYGFHVIAGDFWLSAAALSLGIAAICLLLQGLHNLAGMAGLGVAGVLLLFVSNPLAGLATGPWWLPAPWGTIGQLLPIGAAGTAVRSAAFFDGAGSGQAFAVLGCWALAGFLVSALVTRRRTGARAGS